VLPLQFFSYSLRRCQIWPFMAKYNFQNSQKFSQIFYIKNGNHSLLQTFFIPNKFFLWNCYTLFLSLH